MENRSKQRYRNGEESGRGRDKSQYTTNNNSITGVQYTQKSNNIVAGSVGCTISRIKSFTCNNQRRYADFCPVLVSGEQHATTAVELNNDNNDNSKYHATTG